MKHALWILLIWAAATVPGKTAGLIIVHEEDFWRRPWPYPNPPLIPTPPAPGPPLHRLPPPVWAPLETTLTQVGVKIKEQIAVTSIDQEFYNPNPRQLEGTFLFPVPKGAQINKFSMEINGKQVEAELLAADKARGTYEEIVRKLKDPALLEYAERELFKVRVFPIEPNSTKRIHLAYSQVLKSDGGVVNFQLPLDTGKFSAKPIKTVSLKVELESKRALKSIYSPSHKVEIKRDGPNRATIGYETSDAWPDTDFQLFFTQEEGDLGVNLLTYKAAKEDGFFLLLASSGVERKAAKLIPKDVAFVLDTSGSMAGAKLEQARKALLFCVENLNENDRFEILRFATEVEPLFDQLVDASKENRARARDFIKELRPIGGTAIDDALRKALALRPDKGDRPYVVIFLTDGRPTVGNTDENQIVDGVTKSSKGNVRIFCFGIGTDVNTHLLDKITEETKAFSQYVLPEEDIEVKVSSFFTKIKEPVLANPKMTFPASIRATKLYPSPLPDIFKGEQIILAGRYAGSGSGAVEIEGTVNGEARRFAYDVKFSDEASDHEFIPRLWATRRVGYLLDEIRLRGENAELKDEVTELARKYGIVTPYTAYLILEDERQRGVPAASLSLRELEENEPARRAAGKVYYTFNRAQDGDAAVAGARAFYSLKSAQSAAEAIAQGNVETLRAEPMAATPVQRLAGAGSAGGSGVPALTVGTIHTPATIAVAREYAGQGRFLNGRAFYQNGATWIDFEIQRMPNAKRVRVQFDSPEYFELLKQHPKALAWLSLGRNVQFVLGQSVYEVVE